MATKTLNEKVEKILAFVEEKTEYGVLSEMKAALNSVYGEERNQIVKPSVDMVIKRAMRYEGISVLEERLGKTDEGGYNYLNGYLAFDYDIIIHFPELTIKNARQSHQIRDMYVKLHVQPNGKMRTHIEGVRTTVTEAEYLTGYMHSHLQAFYALSINFRAFCTGVGEINQVLALLNSKYTSANFMMLLMHIKNFLEWESKEGNPFMYMSEISRRSSTLSTRNSLEDAHADVAAQKLLDILKESLPLDKIVTLFTFHVTERGIKATPTLEMEKWMAQEMNTWNVRRIFSSCPPRNRLLAQRDEKGTYYAIPESTPTFTHQQEPVLIFKGKEINFQVIEKTEIIKNEIFANPKITKKLGEKLSSTLTRTALKSPGIRSGSSITYKS